MFSEKLQEAMNNQIKEELYSAYIYLAMAAYFEDENLPGFAHWMQVQSQEEVEHAMKFYSHIFDRGGRVALQAIDQPPADFGSPLGAFQKAFEHEQFITGKINDLYALALKENDYPAQVMLQWFVDEQVEEEKNTGDVVALLERIGDKGHALIMLDRQLAGRQE
jgi:ferritin